MISRRTAIVWVIVASLFSSYVTYDLLSSFYGARLKELNEGLSVLQEADNLDDFLRVAHYVESMYVEKDLTPEELVEGAASGLVEALGDDYSVYLKRSSYQDLMERTTGSFSGIGVVVEATQDGYITVVSPIKGTPAQKAGLKPGDKILAVDGRDISDLNLLDAVDLIKGPEGTEVTLTVISGGEQREVSITRTTIQEPTVQYRALGEGRGYVQLYTFNQHAYEGMRDAIEDLRSQGIRGLILDLRHNPGGLLDESVKIADLLVPKGPVVHIVDRDGARQTMEATGKGVGMPLVVLVDGGSASAAEILAGAVQDREAGILVGTRTFGKGSVQSVFDLDDGAGLKLTVARYLTPSGRSIDGTGIEPDVVVEPSGEEDIQLEKAQEILSRLMKGESIR